MALKTPPAEILDHDNDIDIDIVSLSSVATPPAPSKNAKKTSGTNPETAISVEKYHRSLARKRALIDLDYYYHDESDDVDVQFLDIPPAALLKKQKTLFTCEICAEDRAGTESFRITGCKHSYCCQCVVSYVSSKLQDNVVRIGCPVGGCPGNLQPDRCRKILPPRVLDRWEVAICESSIAESLKFYCPFKDCSALLLMDHHWQWSGTSQYGVQIAVPELITQSQCPYCRRLFCAQCKVPWHQEISCEEFKKLGRDEREREDIMLMKLAKKQKWVRCDKCKFYVEKISGCQFMLCRCGNRFCYRCGNTCKKDHVCSFCKC